MDEKYLTIKIYRFYFRCSQCSAEITFKTDPKNHDYVVEHGAKRGYEAWKDAQQAEQNLKEIKENKEEGNIMGSLECKAYDSKREIEIMDALDDIKQSNKRKAQVTHDQLLNVVAGQEKEDEKDIKKMFKIDKERNLGSNEEKVTGKINEVLNDLTKSEAKVTTLEVTKGKMFGPKISIKAKKVKTEQDSLNFGQYNLVTKENHSKKPGVNLCSYSDTDDN